MGGGIGGDEMKPKCIPLLLLLPALMLVLGGCGGDSQPLPAATPTSTQVLPTATPIPIPIATQVLPRPTATATQVQPTPTATATPTGTLTQVPPTPTAYSLTYSYICADCNPNNR